MSNHLIETIMIEKFNKKNMIKKIFVIIIEI
jgi:hypothetical protein